MTAKCKLFCEAAGLESRLCSGHSNKLSLLHGPLNDVPVHKALSMSYNLEHKPEFAYTDSLIQKN